MKRLMVLLAVAASIAMSASSWATPVEESQQSCDAGATEAGPLSITTVRHSADSARVTLCNDDADFPLEGNIDARGDASQGCATASIDGDPENPYLDFDNDGSGNLDGYAALEVDAGHSVPVGIEEYEDNDYRSDCVSD